MPVVETTNFLENHEQTKPLSIKFKRGVRRSNETPIKVDKRARSEELVRAEVVGKVVGKAYRILT